MWMWAICASGQTVLAAILAPPAPPQAAQSSSVLPATVLNICVWSALPALPMKVRCVHLPQAAGVEVNSSSTTMIKNSDGSSDSDEDLELGAGDFEIDEFGDNCGMTGDSTIPSTFLVQMPKVKYRLSSTLPPLCL